MSALYIAWSVAADWRPRLLDHEARAPSYSADSDPALILESAAVSALLLAGLAAVVVGVRRPAGQLLVLMALVWLLPDLVAWRDGPGWLRSVAMVGAPFLLPLLLHLVLGQTRRHAPALATIGYVVMAIPTVCLALVRDPFYDVYCWPNCDADTLLVARRPELAERLEVAQHGAATALALGVVLLVGYELARSTPRARARSGGLLAASGLVAILQGSYAVALLRMPDERPYAQPFHALFLLRCAALILLAVAVGWLVRRVALSRRAIAKLALDVGQAPDPAELEAELGRRLGDPSLRILYRLPDSDEYVDGTGQPAAPTTRRRMVVTPITRGGEPVAMLNYDAALLTPQDLAGELGSAAQLALDNGRLQAAALAQLRELRASRARIVAAGDAERRRIERDLHDGVQHRLLAVLHELRQADPGEHITSATERTLGVLADLRSLAHGIHPPALDTDGLEAALEGLADRHPLSLKVHGSARRRFPEEVESAVYVLVRDAAAASADCDVELGFGHGVLHVAIRGDPVDMVHATDRVMAAGGTLAASNGLITAELPCES
jgi:signal transduction histidine kinase